jgi:hypothetical protein
MSKPNGLPYKASLAIMGGIAPPPRLKRKPTVENSNEMDSDEIAAVTSRYQYAAIYVRKLMQRGGKQAVNNFQLLCMGDPAFLDCEDDNMWVHTISECKDAADWTRELTGRKAIR